MRSGLSLYSRRSLNFRALRWRPGNIFSMREKSVPNSCMACSAPAPVRLLCNEHHLTGLCQQQQSSKVHGYGRIKAACFRVRYGHVSQFARRFGFRPQCLTVTMSTLTLKKSSVSWGVHLSLLMRLE